MRLGCGRFFGVAWLLLTRRRWRGRRLDHHGNRGRGYHHNRPRGSSCARWRFGDDSARRRTRGDGRRSRRRGNNGRRRTRLRHNLPGLGLGWRRRRRRSDNGRLRRRRAGWRCCRCWLCARRHVGVPSLGFLFLLLGQYGLQHISGFGDMGEIDLGCNRLRGAGRRCARMARSPRSTLKMRADFFGLMLLNGAGVGFALAQAELSQYVKNLTALDFHLACEIVDSNLAHPPLFNICCPRPVSCS